MDAVFARTHRLQAYAGPAVRCHRTARNLPSARQRPEGYALPCYGGDRVIEPVWIQWSAKRASDTAETTRYRHAMVADFDCDDPALRARCAGAGAGTRLTTEESDLDADGSSASLLCRRHAGERARARGRYEILGVCRSRTQGRQRDSRRVRDS